MLIENGSIKMFTLFWHKTKRKRLMGSEKFTFWQSIHCTWHMGSVLNDSIRLFPYDCMVPIKTPCKWLWPWLWVAECVWLWRILFRPTLDLLSEQTSVWPNCMSSALIWHKINQINFINIENYFIKWPPYLYILGIEYIFVFFFGLKWCGERFHRFLFDGVPMEFLTASIEYPFRIPSHIFQIWQIYHNLAIIFR